MCIELTTTERNMLILIYQGKSIKDLAQWRNVTIEVFDQIIRDIMSKTASKTWEELKIIGAQLAQTKRGEQITQEITMEYYLTKEEQASIEYLANKWQRIPENER